MQVYEVQQAMSQARDDEPKQACMQVYEVQQAMSQARDEGEELRIRAQEAEVGPSKEPRVQEASKGFRAHLGESRGEGRGPGSRSGAPKILESWRARWHLQARGHPVPDNLSTGRDAWLNGTAAPGCALRSQHGHLGIPRHVWTAPQSSCVTAEWFAAYGVILLH